MEYIVSRWNKKEIYGDVARCKSKYIILYDAAELLRPFFVLPCSMDQVQQKLHIFQENKMLTSFNNHERLVSLPTFLCFILPAFVDSSNLIPFEKMVLSDWALKNMRSCQVPDIDRIWQENKQDFDVCLEAEKSLFEAGILPRTPLCTEEILHIESNGTSTNNTLPLLLYKPTVLQAHFQDSASCNTIANLVILSDYLQTMDEKQHTQRRPSLRKYRQPGLLDFVYCLDEAYAGKSNAKCLYNEALKKGCANQFVTSHHVL